MKKKTTEEILENIVPEIDIGIDAPATTSSSPRHRKGRKSANADAPTTPPTTRTATQEATTPKAKTLNQTAEPKKTKTKKTGTKKTGTKKTETKKAETKKEPRKKLTEEEKKQHKKEANKKYRESEKGKEVQKRANEKQKAKRAETKKTKTTKKKKETTKEPRRKLTEEEKKQHRKETQAKYSQSEKGKAAAEKSRMNSWLKKHNFPGIDEDTGLLSRRPIGLWGKLTDKQKDKYIEIENKLIEKQRDAFLKQLSEHDTQYDIVEDDEGGYHRQWTASRKASVEVIVDDLKLLSELAEYDGWIKDPAWTLRKKVRGLIKEVRDHNWTQEQLDWLDEQLRMIDTYYSSNGDTQDNVGEILSAFEEGGNISKIVHQAMRNEFPEKITNQDVDIPD